MVLQKQIRKGIIMIEKNITELIKDIILTKLNYLIYNQNETE